MQSLKEALCEKGIEWPHAPYSANNLAVFAPRHGYWTLADHTAILTDAVHKAQRVFGLGQDAPDIVFVVQKTSE
jgi:hypothetical protein